MLLRRPTEDVLKSESSTSASEDARGIGIKMAPSTLTYSEVMRCLSSDAKKLTRFDLVRGVDPEE